jgi:hypothetical protein
MPRLALPGHPGAPEGVNLSGPRRAMIVFRGGRVQAALN